MEEEDRQNVERTGAPSERMGDLFLKVFGPDRGVDLELPKRQPHEPGQVDGPSSENAKEWSLP